LRAVLRRPSRGGRGVGWAAADGTVGSAPRPGPWHARRRDPRLHRQAGQHAYELVKIEYSQAAPLRDSFAPLPRLPANPLATPDTASAQRHRIVFGGGMMGTLPSQDQHKGMFWTLNGRPVREHAHREVLLQLKLRSSYVVELVNETAWHHPVHLHGHVFRV